MLGFALQKKKQNRASRYGDSLRTRRRRRRTYEGVQKFADGEGVDGDGLERERQQRIASDAVAAIPGSFIALLGCVRVSFFLLWFSLFFLSVEAGRTRKRAGVRAWGRKASSLAAA